MAFFSAKSLLSSFQHDYRAEKKKIFNKKRVKELKWKNSAQFPETDRKHETLMLSLIRATKKKQQMLTTTVITRYNSESEKN